MRRLLWPMMLAASLWALSGDAAGRKPSDFNAAPEMTEEELAAAKARSKSHLNGFDEKMEEMPTCGPFGGPAKCKPFPWAFVVLTLLAFGVGSVFMVRAFRTTSKELKAQDGYAGGRNRASSEE
jgi:hypothetical protein